MRNGFLMTRKLTENYNKVWLENNGYFYYIGSKSKSIQYFRITLQVGNQYQSSTIHQDWILYEVALQELRIQIFSPKIATKSPFPSILDAESLQNLCSSLVTIPCCCNQVDYKKTEAIKYHRVKPTHFTDNQVLKLGNSIKDLKQHVSLFQGAQFELVQHFPERVYQ